MDEAEFIFLIREDDVRGRRIFDQDDTENGLRSRQGSSLLACGGIAFVSFCSKTQDISTGFSAASHPSYVQLLKIALG